MTTKSANTPPELWTIKQASDFANCHIATIYGRIENGIYQAYRVGGKLKVDAESVRVFHNPTPIPVKPKRRKAPRDASARAEA